MPGASGQQFPVNIIGLLLCWLSLIGIGVGIGIGIEIESDPDPDTDPDFDFAQTAKKNHKGNFIYSDSWDLKKSPEIAGFRRLSR